jgi:hypothetical protein
MKCDECSNRSDNPPADATLRCRICATALCEACAIWHRLFYRMNPNDLIDLIEPIESEDQ